MRFAFLRFFLSFLGVFVFVFVVVYISYVCHTCHNADCIKNRKIIVCKKTSSQFCVLVWYAMRGFEQTLYLVRGYNPSVFSACKTSRKSSSPYTGEPRTALRWLSARLYLTALRSRALSLPQSYCLNPERSPTAPSSEGAEAAAAAHHRIYLRGSQVGAADSAAVLKFPHRAQGVPTRAQGVLTRAQGVPTHAQGAKNPVLKMSTGRSAKILLCAELCAELFKLL